MIINYNDFNNSNDLMYALLDKITNDGFDKLSDKEKKILNKLSNGESINLEKLKRERKKTNKEVTLDNNIPLHPKFNIGDGIYPLFIKDNNLPLYAYQYLKSKNKFTVLKVKLNGKIDIGCHKYTDDGKKRVFYYSPNRFTSINSFTETDDNIEFDNTNYNSFGILNNDEPNAIDNNNQLR